MSKKTIFIMVMLLAGYCVVQAIADVGATKLVEIAGIVVPAGSLLFAVTFTLRDLIHKRLGKDFAVAAIAVAAIMNIVQAGFLYLVSIMQAPVFYEMSGAWSAIFAFVPAITIGSIVAEVASELVDTEVYHAWWKAFPKAPQWSRVIISNIVSLPVDSFVFAMLAFVVLPELFGGDSVSLVDAMKLTFGQIVFKIIITVASMPMIYLVKDKDNAKMTELSDV